VGAEWWCSEHPLAPGQRDRLAAKAMQVLLAFYGLRDPVGSESSEDVVRWSYQIADTIMALREKKLDDLFPLLRGIEAGTKKADE
jgi:hypothetical protein